MTLEEKLREEREEGREEGRVEGSLRTLNKLVHDGLITKEVAAEQFGMTVEEFDSAVKALGDMQSEKVALEK